jgi:hypothetical protein
MAKIVLNLIALTLQHIDALIFNLPSGATKGTYLFNYISTWESGLQTKMKYCWRAMTASQKG